MGPHKVPMGFQHIYHQINTMLSSNSNIQSRGIWYGRRKSVFWSQGNKQISYLLKVTVRDRGGNTSKSQSVSTKTLILSEVT